MEIVINKDLTLDEINVLHQRLSRFEDIDGDVDLKIPAILENDFVGLVPALYQFVFTWIRYKNSGKLSIDIKSTDPEDIDSLFESEHIFPIVVLVWNTKDILDGNGERSIRRDLIGALALLRTNMLKVRPLKGKKLLLVSIDHFPPASGTLPCYETAEGFIDNETNTYRNLKSAIDEVLNYSHDVKNAFEMYGRHFISMIHELIKNTYEWGKTDGDNVALDPNIRGLLVKFYKKRRATFIDEFKMHKGLLEYFESNTLRENSNTELYFIEISVFDSGIGFVDRYERNDKQKLDGVQIIKRCLIKHMTSASGLEKDDKGIGLDRILNLLDKKGFLRIKTDSYCLYRNLITHPYKSVDNEKDLELFDWKNQSNNNYETLPKAVGSTLTILYPLAINFQQ